MLALSYSAEIYQELTFHSLTSQIWAIPFLAYLALTDIAHANKWIVWAIITLLLSFPNRKLSLFVPFSIAILTPLSAPNSSRLELSQLKRRPFTNGLSSYIQHVCTG